MQPARGPRVQDAAPPFGLLAVDVHAIELAVVTEEPQTALTQNLVLGSVPEACGAKRLPDVVVRPAHRPRATE